MTEELPILSARDVAVEQAGIKIRNPADEKMYPVPGQGVLARQTASAFSLPVIEVQHLNAAPTLKSWLDSQDGKPLCPEHEPIITALKNARKNGAPINLNVNPEGFYNMAFSGANGNSVTIADFKGLLDAGLNLGDCLRVTKLVCGPNGVCGNPGPCAMCRDIRDGCYTDAVFAKAEKPAPALLPHADPIDEEINLLVADGRDYRLHGTRIVNMENSKSADVTEVRALCRSMSKGVIYVLEMIGVYRPREGKSHTALKRADLGGH